MTHPNYCLENACDVSAAAALSVTLVDNLETAVVYEVCTLATCCVETSVEPTCPCYGTVTVGMYGKMIIIVTALSTHVEVGSDLIPANGGSAKVVGAYVCPGYGWHSTVEVDESDVLPSYS